MEEKNEKKRIVAVIPCHNESKTIADIVARAKKYCQWVIVVDSNSNDRTGEISKADDVYYWSLKGAGWATDVGLVASLVRGEVIVTLDGDGQHNPDEIPKVVKPILEDRADLVIGSRFMNDYKIAKYRKFGIDVITGIYNLGHKQKIKDAQSCFRAFNKDILMPILPLEEKGFSFSVETLIKARSMGYRIMEVPISCIYHDDFRQNSSMNPILHGLSVALGTIKWRIALRN